MNVCTLNKIEKECAAKLETSYKVLPFKVYDVCAIRWFWVKLINFVISTHNFSDFSHDLVQANMHSEIGLTKKTVTRMLLLRDTVSALSSLLLLLYTFLCTLRNPIKTYAIDCLLAGNIMYKRLTDLNVSKHYSKPGAFDSLNFYKTKLTTI